MQWFTWRVAFAHEGDGAGDMERDGFTIWICADGASGRACALLPYDVDRGLALVFPRDHWPRIKSRSEFAKAGVLLVGYVGY